MRFRFLPAILVAGVAAVALTGCSSSPSTTGNDLVGTWTGTHAGYEGPEAVYVERSLTLVVQEANGQAFFGYKQWTDELGNVADEMMKGAVTEDGQITIVYTDGLIEGVVSGSTLTATSVEMGEDGAVLEVELTKQ